MTCSYSTPSQSDIDNHLLVFDIKAYTRLRDISLSTTKTIAVNCSLSFIQTTGTVAFIRYRLQIRLIMITELTSTTAKQLNKLFLNIPVHLCTCIPVSLTNKTLCLLSLFMSCVQRGSFGIPYRECLYNPMLYALSNDKAL